MEGAGNQRPSPLTSPAHFPGWAGSQAHLHVPCWDSCLVLPLSEAMVSARHQDNTEIIIEQPWDMAFFSTLTPKLQFLSELGTRGSKLVWGWIWYSYSCSHSAMRSQLVRAHSTPFPSLLITTQTNSSSRTESKHLPCAGPDGVSSYINFLLFFSPLRSPSP